MVVFMPVISCLGYLCANNFEGHCNNLLFIMDSILSDLDAINNEADMNSLVVYKIAVTAMKFGSFDQPINLQLLLADARK